jgi:hypothetical protein
LGVAALPAAARTNVDFFVNVAPPPVYQEVVPAPRVGYIWVPGYWDWRYGRYYWVAGSWARHRPGYTTNRCAGTIGTAVTIAAGGWRDSDHDGVPNRYDRAPYNAYYR